MTVLEILEAAYKLIRPKSRWTQGVAALDADGVQTGADSAEAVKWCAVGAIDKFATPKQAIIAFLALDRARPRSSSTAEFNDTHTHREVLAMFRKAIAEEKRKAAK